MFNLVVLTGRLTADPELKKTPNGISVTTFSIAVSRRYRAGEETQADFITIVAWRQTAEFITRYFKKASSICVVGKLQNRSWTDHNDVKHYATDVVADEAYFVDSKNEKTEAIPEYVPSAYTDAAPQFEEIAMDEELPF